MLLKVSQSMYHIEDVNCIENEFLKKLRLAVTGDLSSMPIYMAKMGSHRTRRIIECNSGLL